MFLNYISELFNLGGNASKLAEEYVKSAIAVIKVQPMMKHAPYPGGRSAVLQLHRSLRQESHEQCEVILQIFCDLRH
jgi:hypothetical protein